jgi:hypothetical protein
MRGYGPIYTVIEAYHGLRANSLVNLLATGTISMAMLIVGFVLVVFLNLQSAVGAMGEFPMRRHGIHAERRHGLDQAPLDGVPLRFAVRKSE